jgi:hypothetical protein
MVGEAMSAHKLLLVFPTSSEGEMPGRAEGGEPSTPQRCIP